MDRAYAELPRLAFAANRRERPGAEVGLWYASGIAVDSSKWTLGAP
jgi:hypothetical protein